MGDPYNIFISWSKDRGKAAATALREWLPDVIQAAKPWMSDKDIDKGTVWLDELTGALANLKLGIVCLTPENVSEPWLLYEAGVISKALDRKTRVWTYLLGGLKKEDVPQPLGLFQATVSEEADTYRLLTSVNDARGEQAISQEALKKQFGKYWLDLKEKLSKLPDPKGAVIPKRSPEEMFAELLEFSRAGADVRSEIAALAGEINLVGEAVEELADVLASRLPTTASIGTPISTRRIFGGIGVRRRFNFYPPGTTVPLSTLAGAGQTARDASPAVEREKNDGKDERKK